MYILSLIAVVATAMWYGVCLKNRTYQKAIAAGFVASATQWLMLYTNGHTPMRAMFYTAAIFCFMIFAWLVIEYKHARTKDKEWQPSTSFWVYFIGGMTSCIGICQCIV